jgi:hypothetical protein
MVGKLSSLRPLVDAAPALSGARTLRTTELYQGRTARWCLAWSHSPPEAFLDQGWRFVGDGPPPPPPTSSSSSSSSSSTAVADGLDDGAADDGVGEVLPTVLSGQAAAKRSREDADTDGPLSSSATHKSDRRRNVRSFRVRVLAPLPPTAPLTPRCSPVGSAILSPRPSLADADALQHELQAASAGDDAAADQGGDSAASAADLPDLIARIEAVLAAREPVHGLANTVLVNAVVRNVRKTCVGLLADADVGAGDGAGKGGWRAVASWGVWCASVPDAEEAGPGASGAGRVEFFAEVQILARAAAGAGENTSSPSSGAGGEVVVVAPTLLAHAAPLDTSGSGGKLDPLVSFERFAERLRRDVRRTGRKWRRAAARAGGGGGGNS